MKTELATCSRDELRNREEDELADTIGSLTAEEADTLWSVIIQRKRHLRD
jgi:hypothetical protein